MLPGAGARRRELRPVSLGAFSCAARSISGHGGLGLSVRHGRIRLGKSQFAWRAEVGYRSLYPAFRRVVPAGAARQDGSEIPRRWPRYPHPALRLNLVIDFKEWTTRLSLSRS